MNIDLNVLIVAGRITTNPVIRQTHGGHRVCTFGLAIHRKTATTTNTSFIDCSAWNGLADFIMQYFTKGRQIIIHGRIQQDRWIQDGSPRSKVIIIAEQVRFTDYIEADSTPQDEQLELDLGI